MTVVFCEYNNQVPRLVARANGLVCDSRTLAQELDKEAREIRPGRYFDECVEILTGGDVTELGAFASGLLQFQDESTLLAVRLLNPLPGETIIDMCAAPGGKTTYIAERMVDRGTIKAYEISEHRADRLRQNIRRMSVHCCDVTCADAVDAAEGPADGVLVDVPCTGTGTLGRRVDSRWKFDLMARERVRSDVEELRRMHPRQVFAHQVSRQLRLLLRAANLVGEDGRIVYSTCTMEPEENEQVIDWFLKKRPDFELQDAASFVPEMFVDDGFVRVLPQRHGIDGAFAARLVRRKGARLSLEAEETASLEIEVEKVGTLDAEL
jgi:16S rRNA (cytosine967-C5)-methyltransferase